MYYVQFLQWPTYFCIMNTQPIREHLRRGETADALRALIALLEPDKRYKKNFLRVAQLNEAAYQAVRQKELKGILAFPETQREYSRINDALLELLDNLEEGRLPPATPRPGARRYRPWIAGAVLALALSAGGWLYSERQAETKAWQRAAEQHTRAAYLEYRKQYPDHTHTLAAADSLARLEERVQYLLQSARAFIAADAFGNAAKALETVARLDPQNPELTRLSEQLPK